MKKIYQTILFFWLLILSHLALAQPTEGIITYETKVNLHRRFGKGQEAMKNVVPEFRTTKQILVFNAHESLWKSIEEEEDDLDVTHNGMRMRVRTPRMEVYQLPEQAKKLTLREFLGKTYLVIDSIRVIPWKLNDQSKEILGYVCKQAQYTDEKGNQIVAWYTSKLRPSLGPENYSTLPGTVLEVEVNNGEQVIQALKIDGRLLKKGELTEPNKGHIITEKDYQVLVAEQMRRMGGNGNIIIRN